MLRIWKISGEELASFPVEELSDVMSLKHRLRAKHQIPVSLLRLVYDGCRLDDAFRLCTPMDVQLIVKSRADKVIASNELLGAAADGEAEVVRLLLLAGAAKDFVNRHGKTALILATDNGREEVVRELFEAGVAKDLTDAVGKTALIYASSHGDIHAARLLLEAGAAKRVQDAQRRTALVYSASQGHVEIVRLLLEASASPNLTDGCGQTALHAASSTGCTEVVRVLLDATACAWNCQIGWAEQPSAMHPRTAMLMLSACCLRLAGLGT